MNRIVVGFAFTAVGCGILGGNAVPKIEGVTPENAVAGHGAAAAESDQEALIKAEHLSAKPRAGALVSDTGIELSFASAQGRDVWRFETRLRQNAAKRTSILGVGQKRHHRQAGDYVQVSRKSTWKRRMHDA
jgi:hypothetical protein